MVTRHLRLGLLLALSSCTFDRAGAGAEDLQPARPESGSTEGVARDLGVKPGRDGLGRDGPTDAARDARDSTADKPKTVDTLADSIPVAKPFGAPTAITKLNTASIEDDPTLAADLLEICFDSDRPGGLGQGDIWCATRTSANGTWGTPLPMVLLNTIASETTPELSSDGLVIYYASNRTGGPGDYDIYYSKRTSRTAPWSAPQVVSALSSAQGDYAPTSSSDQLFMVMGSLRTGGAGGFDLYVSTRSSTTVAWGTPKAVTELNTSAVETDPAFNPGRTVLYFSSDRAGGQGSWEIWRVVRTSATATFGAPAPVVELNSASGESDVWLSPDTSMVVFASDRGGNWDLYLATR